MSTITIAIPDDLSAQLEPYRDQLDHLLRIGLREIKKSFFAGPQLLFAPVRSGRRLSAFRKSRTLDSYVISSWEHIEATRPAAVFTRHRVTPTVIVREICQHETND